MAMRINSQILTVPNALSGYRVLVTPLILYFIFAGWQQFFLLFLFINIISDILDGAIARAFKMQTNFGARLDSIGDIGTYIAAAYGTIEFKWHDISNAGGWLWIFVAFFILPFIVSFLKFRKLPSLHLYSSKIGGAIDGVFFFYLFFFGYSPWLLALAIGWGICSFIEQIVVLLLLTKLKPDAKGLYWVLKSLK
jgi:cardiolipin synthase (CMP-forming)